MEFLNEGYTGTIVGVVGILVSTILSVYFYRKSLNRPRPAYQMASMRVIEEVSDTNGYIEIMFNGIKVERVVKTQVAFWNAGSSTINSNDIVERDPIIIKFSERTEILNYKIISPSREVISFELTALEKSNQLAVTFDYLDSDDGALIEIIHNDTKLYPKISGTVKGNKKGITDYGKLSYPLIAQGKRKFGNDFYAASSITMLSLYIILAHYFPNEVYSDPDVVKIIIAASFFGVFSSIVLLVFNLLRRKKFPQRRFKQFIDSKLTDDSNL